MASRIWLLVEWVDESDVFPVYSIVNVDTTAYGENELHQGNLIFVCVKRENPRRAKILRLSDSKRYLKEHKEILERQDMQVKNVLQMCVRTIKEMKSDSPYPQIKTPNNSSCSLPQVYVAHEGSSSDSDSDTKRSLCESRVQTHNHQDLKFSNSNHKSRGVKQSRYHRRSMSNGNYSRSNTLISSTPLPANIIQSNKLCLDQATQTEGTYEQTQTSKIEELETVLKGLYGRFESLVSQANIDGAIPEVEHNEDILYDMEPTVRAAWAEDNVEVDEQQDSRHVHESHDVNNEQVNETAQQHVINESNAEEPGQSSCNLRVRKMPAQTTNNIETASNSDVDMVPIGSGNAKVPARLLNDIDWNSYTNATRQLLQAIFPRKVLATHSLTGKQSPAFLNRPPKKILEPKLVDDIVKTVSARCGVPKNLVRNSITIKCTDEAKLYRNRQRYRQSAKSLRNDENAPPSTPSSDDLSNVS